MAESFGNLHVAVIGDLMLDHFIHGFCERPNPEMPGSPILRVSSNEYRLGGAANVALNCRSLGANVSLFGIVGADVEGDIIEKMCSDNGIGLFCVKNGETIVKERWIEISRSHYLGRADYGESEKIAISVKDFNSLFDKLKSLKFDAIILSDYNKKMFVSGFGSEIVKWAKENNIICVVDPRPSNVLSLKGATVFTPNLSEAKEITGLDEVRDVAKELKILTESDFSIVTCGENGMVAYDGDFHHVPTKARKVVDVTGAGDTATAVLTLALAQGKGIAEAMNWANEAAGIVVEKSGTASVTIEELIERLVPGS